MGSISRLADMLFFNYVYALYFFVLNFMYKILKYNIGINRVCKLNVDKKMSLWNLQTRQLTLGLSIVLIFQYQFDSKLNLSKPVHFSTNCRGTLDECMHYMHLTLCCKRA